MRQKQSVIDALRSATGQRHQAIESLLQLDKALDMARYKRIMVAFDLFLSCWEPRIQAALPPRLHGWFAARSRRGFIERDMAWLDAKRMHVSPKGDPTRFLQLPDDAAAFGSLYVLEGSALGGQVIAPALARNLGLGPDSGAAYFTGWGARTGAMWREFRDLLAVEIGSKPARVEAACAAAVQTFDSLAVAFRKVMHEQHAIA